MIGNFVAKGAGNASSVPAVEAKKKDGKESGSGRESGRGRRRREKEAAGERLDVGTANDEFLLDLIRWGKYSAYRSEGGGSTQIHFV